jgi:hypothetical protein
MPAWYSVDFDPGCKLSSIQKERRQRLEFMVVQKATKVISSPEALLDGFQTSDS